MLNPDFKKVLLILLEIGKNQMQSRTTSLTEVRAIGGLSVIEVDRLVDRLKFAELLSANDDNIRLRRSAKQIRLSEIYAAVIPTKELPKTSFDELYQTIAEQAHAAATEELHGLDLCSSLAELLTPSEN